MLIILLSGLRDDGASMMYDFLSFLADCNFIYTLIGVAVFVVIGVTS